jgi:hypothetical protein
MALDWNTLSWPKRMAIAIPFAGAFLGWQYYTKGQEAKQMKAQMIEMCGHEAPCVAAVERHAETCFNAHYRMGRRSQGVKMDEFVACVNQHSGTEFFSTTPSD